MCLDLLINGCCSVDLSPPTDRLSVGKRTGQADNGDAIGHAPRGPVGGEGHEEPAQEEAEEERPHQGPPLRWPPWGWGGRGDTRGGGAIQKVWRKRDHAC